MPFSGYVSDIYDSNIDEVSDTITYIGEANPGTSDSVPKWRIKRIETVGTVIKIRWADASSDFNKIWDDRASLTY
jgi:hypothetical protein